MNWETVEQYAEETGQSLAEVATHHAYAQILREARRGKHASDCSGYNERQCDCGQVDRIEAELHRLRELVKQADLRHIRLRDGLRKACDEAWTLAWKLHRECPNDLDETEHPRTVQRIADLRKLLGGEP